MLDEFEQLMIKVENKMLIYGLKDFLFFIC